MNAATDTLCSTLTSCLDDICPLSSRPARTAPSNLWLSDVLSEWLRAAERKWQKSNDPSDLSMYQSLLSSFSAEVHTAKSSHFHNKINSAPDMRNLFKTFNSTLCPPSPPPTTSITAVDFATFFTDKIKTISSQFKTLVLAYRTTTGSAPTYFHSLLRIYIPSRSLRSASERRLVVPSQRGSKSLSRTFSFTVPGWWNDLPTPIRNAGSLSIFKQQLKTHLFQHYLTSS